jgi:hypothetical protein
MTCNAAGCSDPAIGVYCSAHAAAKSDDERKRDGRR